MGVGGDNGWNVRAPDLVSWREEEDREGRLPLSWTQSRESSFGQGVFRLE